MVVDRLNRGGAGSREIPAPAGPDLLQLQLQLLPAIRHAKAQLSTVEQTVIDIPELNLRLPFSRAELDVILEPVLRQLRDSITTVLGKAEHRWPRRWTW